MLSQLLKLQRIFIKKLGPTVIKFLPYPIKRNESNKFFIKQNQYHTPLQFAIIAKTYCIQIIEGIKSCKFYKVTEITKIGEVN